MKRASLRAAWLVLGALGLVACAALQGSPETAERDTCESAVVVCAGYDAAPRARHTPAGDKFCSAVARLCQSPAAAEGGAGGAP